MDGPPLSHSQILTEFNQAAQGVYEVGSAALIVLLTQPNYDFFGPVVDDVHAGNLLTFPGVVELVKAKSIGPDISWGGPALPKLMQRVVEVSSYFNQLIVYKDEVTITFASGTPFV